MKAQSYRNFKKYIEENTQTGLDLNIMTTDIKRILLKHFGRRLYDEFKGVFDGNSISLSPKFDNVVGDFLEELSEDFVNNETKRYAKTLLTQIEDLAHTLNHLTKDKVEEEDDEDTEEEEMDSEDSTEEETEEEA